MLGGAGGGVWGTNASIVSDGNGLSGDKYLELVASSNTAPGPTLYSAEFPINAREWYAPSL